MNKILFEKNKLLFQLPPYVVLEFNQTNHKWKGMGGLDLKVIQILSDIFNFTIEILNCGFKWGQKLPNNTWDGIIGKVLYKVNNKFT